MKLARPKLILLALVSALVLCAAPSSASAYGPKPTLSGIPTLTNQTTITFSISTTVPSGWFVKFKCGYRVPPTAPCVTGGSPTCIPTAGGQQVCTQSVTSPYLPLGLNQFLVRASYCEEATLSECDIYDGWLDSVMVIDGFTVDRLKPPVTLTGGPDKKRQVLKPGSRSFAFSSPEALPFVCSIDDGPNAPCTSPFKLPKYLKNGLHTFFVFATDAAGNQGGASRNFRVDVFHPKKCKKGKSKSAKAKRKKCVAKNKKSKKAWKKKHGLK